MLHAGVHNAPPLLHGYTKRVVYPYPVRIRYGYALDTPRIRSRPYPKILDTYWYGYVYPIRALNHQREAEERWPLLWSAKGRQRSGGGCCCGQEVEEERRPLLRRGWGRRRGAATGGRGLSLTPFPLAPPLWIRGETTASGRRGLRMPLPARFCCWTPRFRHLTLEQTAGRKGVSGSVTAAHEPAHLGGHDGDEVRTESWGVVEAGRGVWARGVVRHVGGARRAG